MSATASNPTGLTPALAARLAVFGPQVAPFVAGYLARWAPYKADWNYEDGCVWKGVLDLAKAAGERSLADWVAQAIDARLAPDGSIARYRPDEFNIDNVKPGAEVARLWQASAEPRYRVALEQQLAQLDRHPRTATGNFWHKLIYPHQVWLDGLFMAQPLRCIAARLLERPALIADVLNQFTVVYERMRDPCTGLLYHGWDESRSERWSDPATGLSANFWARAMGWYVMALADCIEILGDDKLAVPVLAAMLEDATQALLRVRSPDGLWYQVLDKADTAGNYEEASASLMIATALMKGARLDVLDAFAGAAGEQALRSCIGRYLDAEHLRGICGVAGLGNTPYRDGSVAYYLSEPIVADDPKGVAALLMALAEALRR